jgi:hypothetical protein
MLALESLSKSEKRVVISRLLEDEELREDLIDIAVYEQRKNEPTRPFSEYLKGKQQRKN